jgi:nitrate reductase NapE component
MSGGVYSYNLKKVSVYKIKYFQDIKLDTKIVISLGIVDMLAVKYVYVIGFVLWCVSSIADVPIPMGRHSRK